MRVIGQELRRAGRAAAPRGHVRRLELRTSVDMLLALATMLLAVGMAVGYQLFRWRAAGDRSS